jgi:hypothetical protein
MTAAKYIKKEFIRIEVPDSRDGIAYTETLHLSIKDAKKLLEDLKKALEKA